MTSRKYRYHTVNLPEEGDEGPEPGVPQTTHQFLAKIIYKKLII